MKPQSNEQVKFVVPAVIALAVGFLWLCLLGGSPVKIESSTLISSGAAYLPLITQGEWWRLLFASALHGGVLFLVVNCICLFRIGGIAEKIFGAARCLAIFILAAAAGNLLSLYCYPFIPAVGAAGAIAGLFGALWGAILSEPQKVPQFKKDPLTIGLFLGMNLLAIRNGSLLAMSLGGFVAVWTAMLSRTVVMAAVLCLNSLAAAVRTDTSATDLDTFIFVLFLLRHFIS